MTGTYWGAVCARFRRWGGVVCVWGGRPVVPYQRITYPSEHARAVLFLFLSFSPPPPPPPAIPSQGHVGVILDTLSPEGVPDEYVDSIGILLSETVKCGQKKPKKIRLGFRTISRGFLSGFHPASTPLAGHGVVYSTQCPY